MASEDSDRGRDFVLRALAATEIAEGCCNAAIRQSFMDLAEHWLDLAQLVLKTPEPPAGSAR
ncbi:MAG: hypothetical protein ACREE0_19090 [Phenylobacterium sp.]